MAVAEFPLRERIGPYRIVARVGAGGMGEVFKAWDPRLERDVAIKLLHPEMAGDTDRQRRLLAEGRAASALNHPSILRVYDADIDGSSYYLVSEWLEGNSLRQELARGALPVKRLLDLAVQIADGLAAAHSMGIVHRDIKPENVMLARDGTARIVDFGLARADGLAPGMTSAAGALTVTLDNGLSGTPAYMSPEQARGTRGDFRSDQFSFGALIYELATGRHAFRRDTMAETLAAVLHDEPKSMVAINPRIPVAVAWVVEQCLAKDAGERYAATEDLARELRRVRERLREALAQPTAAGVAIGPRRSRTALVAGITALLTAALALAVIAMEPAPPEQRFTPIASTAAYEGTPVWSPDGQSLAWVADVDGVLQLFVRRLADAVATQVTRGRFDAEQPFWAPDGRVLYFISAAGAGNGLWTVGSAGGGAELMLENVNHAAIDPTGQRLALLRPLEGSLNQQFWWASAKGESPTLEARTPFDKQSFALGGQLQFRPDGEQVLVWVYNNRGGAQPRGSASDFLLVPIAPEGPVRKVLTSIVGTANLQPFSWLPDNRHVVVGIADASGGNRHLWLGDTESPALRRITATHTNETFPSVSKEGSRIAYASEDVDFDLIALAEDGRTRRTLLATARNEMDPAWSPLGDQFAFVTDRTGPMEIWVRSRDAQWERPLVTSSDFSDSTRTDTFGSLAFSPDGRRLAYQRLGSEFAIWITPATGGTPVRLIDPIITKSGYQDAPAWSPDGEWISFVLGDGVLFHLAKVRVGTNEPVVLVNNIVPFSRADWSPDGQWLACETLEGLMRVPADGGAPQVLLPEPVLAFAWAADSQHIVALVESEIIGHLALIEINTLTRDIKTLNPDLGTIPVAYQPIRGFSYAKGRGFLTSLASARSDIWLLEGFHSRAIG